MTIAYKDLVQAVIVKFPEPVYLYGFKIRRHGWMAVGVKKRKSLKRYYRFM
jgi:hypothetical protein